MSFSALWPEAHAALGRAIAAIDWPEVVSEPRAPGNGTWVLTHQMCRGVGPTAEEAIAEWVNDTKAHLAQYPSEWIWWRQRPEIDCQKDFEHDCLVWGVFSRMVLSGAGERLE